MGWSPRREMKAQSELMKRLLLLFVAALSVGSSVDPQTSMLAQVAESFNRANRNEFSDCATWSNASRRSQILGMMALVAKSWENQDAPDEQAGFDLNRAVASPMEELSDMFP